MADQTEIATVLPKELRLGVPPKMPQARSYLFRQQSTLSGYQSGNTIQINIPRLQRSYLRKDSYLRFRVNGTFNQKIGTDILLSPVAGLALDTPGAFGFIEKIEVFDYLGSTVLESISGVPQLSALLLDLGLRNIIDRNNGNAACGLGLDYTFSGTPGIVSGGVPGGASVSNSGFLYPPSTGKVLYAPTLQNRIPDETDFYVQGYKFSEEFAIPLPSFLGILSEKMIPLHNGFTIVITLANKNVPFMFYQNQEVIVESSANEDESSDTTIANKRLVNGVVHNQIFPLDTNASRALEWDISDVYMNCQILELGPVAESMIMSSTQGSPLVVHSKSMRNYVGNVKGATWSYNTSSVKGGAAITFALDLSSVSLEDRTMVLRSDTHGDTTIVLPKVSIASMTTLLSTLSERASPLYTFTAPATNTLQISATFPFIVVQSGASVITSLKLNTASSPVITSNPNTLGATGPSEFTLNMNLNVASLTNILWMMRPVTQLDSLTNSSSGHRTRNFLHRWQFQYGSTTLPQSNGIQTMGSSIPSSLAVTTSDRKYGILSGQSAEGFEELMKARPVYLPANRLMYSNFNADFTFNKDLDPSGAIGPFINMFGITPSVNSFYNVGRFAAGLNLQLANGKEGQIICGLNTNGMNTSIRGIFHPMFTDYMDSVRVDAWAEYDAFINISPGIATTVSF